MNSVRTLRKQLHMTQAEFAEYCDVSIVSINRYEAGCGVSSTNAIKIAQACRVPLDTVLSSSPGAQSETCVYTSPEEEDLLANYRILTQKGKQRLQDTLSDLLRIYSSVKNK